jgi:hypothetical protein
MAGSNDLVQSSSCFELFETDLSFHLDVGDELALMRPVFLQLQIYGFSIFFNPTKPGGKFHFRFYLHAVVIVCMCAYVCTQEMCDTADGYQAPTARVHPYTKSRNNDSCWAEDDWF